MLPQPSACTAARSQRVLKLCLPSRPCAARLTACSAARKGTARNHASFGLACLRTFTRTLARRLAQDVDQDLEHFQDHEIIRGILEQGRVLTEYAKDVDDKLRQTEMDSIQVGQW